MIQPQYRNLNALASERVFRIPRYQRFYSWRTAQLDDLFGDISQLATKTDADHFMATIVCQKRSQVERVGAAEYGVYDIVDGQQRITSLVLLLKSIEKRMDEACEDKARIAKLLVKDDDKLLLLQTNNPNQEILWDYIKHGEIPGDADLKTQADQRLKTAMVECEDFVDRWAESGNDLVDLLSLMLNHLGFVIYDTTDPGAVYTLFEVLNSRGLPVDWLDKCKSMLMGVAYESAANSEQAKEKIDIIHGIWGSIYQKLAEHPVPGHEIIRIAATLRSTGDAGKPVTAEDALEQFRAASNKPDDAIGVSQWLRKVTYKLVDLRDNPYLEAVTAILHARLLAVALELSDALTTEERKKALTQWERVTFRIFGLYRKDARSKVGDYVRLARNIIAKADGASRYSEIMRALRKLGKDHPINKAVEVGLEETNCYEGYQSECRYILWRYEEHLAEKESGAIDAELREAIWRDRSAAESIEHVFPQNPEMGGPWEGKLEDGEDHQDHVHRIGNLILLPRPLNQEAQRKAFSVKKEQYYAKSEKLRHVQQVMDEDDWDQRTIKERESRIAEWAMKAWDDVSD